MRRASTILVVVMLPLLAAAEEPAQERLSLSLGVFVTDRDTDLRLDSVRGRGTLTDFEEDLGLERRSTVFRLDGYVRFTGPHRLDFSYFDLSRNSSKQIDEEIEWGDETFPINAFVRTDFDLEIYKAAYTYEFRQRDGGGFFGISGGLYVADFATSLSEASLGIREVSSLTAPLPVIGIRGQRQLSDRWTIRSAAEFFFLQYDNYKGNLGDIYAVADYRLRDNVALGFGLNSVRLSVRARKDRFDSRLKWRYNGALVYLKLDF